MDILKDLNEKQKEAVETIKGPILIIAGPGSGKTRVLAHRIAFLIEKGINSRNILAVTFTNKAAQEMRDRVVKLVRNVEVVRDDDFKQDRQSDRSNSYSRLTPVDEKAAAKLPAIGTFHSICARILRREADKIGWRKNFVIYDDNDQLSLIKELLKELEIDPKQFQPTRIASVISSLKSELADAEKYETDAYEYFPKIISKIYKSYEIKLRERNAFDFDDLIMKTVKLFKTYPKILERYQNKFEYLLVDEYQDTNTAQYQFSNLIAKKHGNICAIGDSDQAIYSWRNADFRNILNFERDWPKAKIILLEENYRSTKNILDAAQNMISKNRLRKEKNLWTKNSEGSKINLVLVNNELEEGEFISNKIEKLTGKSNLKFKDFAVLYRTNAQSRAIEEAFLKTNLPYKIIGSVKFYERKEVKDILAYLKIIQNPLELLSLKRILNTPSRGLPGIKNEDFPEIAHNLFTKNKFSLNLPAKKLEALEKFRSIITGLKNRIEKPASDEFGKIAISLPEFIKFTFKETGYKDYLASLPKEEAQTRLENIKELFTVASKFNEFEPKKALTDFLENIALISDADQVEDKKNLVNFMTLHSAKGLEFNTVFIAGCEDGLLPHSQSVFEENELEEERRLCYVGITRAKENLYLLLARYRNLYGQTQVNPPSRFIEDIPTELVSFYESELKEIEF